MPRMVNTVRYAFSVPTPGHSVLTARRTYVPTRVAAVRDPKAAPTDTPTPLRHGRHLPHRASVGAATLGAATLLAPSATINVWLLLPLTAALITALLLVRPPTGR